LSTAPDRIGYLNPSNPDDAIEDMHRRYEEQGYLYLKGLLDRTSVLDFRAWVFARLSSSGILQEGTEAVEGIAAQSGFDKQGAGREIMSIVRSAEFEDFCKQPRLVAFIEAFLGGTTHLHKRKLMRVTYPESGMTTPAHYDRVYLRAGTERLVTAWLPIGDVSLEEGGLMYLEGSHVLGRDMEAQFKRQAADLPASEKVSAFNALMNPGGEVSDDLPELADRFDRRWLMASFEAGDVMLHDPYMIHASTENCHQGNRMRLSSDIRFQRTDEALDKRWDQHWRYDDDL